MAASQRAAPGSAVPAALDLSYRAIGTASIARRLYYGVSRSCGVIIRPTQLPQSPSSNHCKQLTSTLTCPSTAYLNLSAPYRPYGPLSPSQSAPKITNKFHHAGLIARRIQFSLNSHSVDQCLSVYPFLSLSTSTFFALRFDGRQHTSG